MGVGATRGWGERQCARFMAGFIGRNVRIATDGRTLNRTASVLGTSIRTESMGWIASEPGSRAARYCAFAFAFLESRVNPFSLSTGREALLEEAERVLAADLPDALGARYRAELEVLSARIAVGGLRGVLAPNLGPMAFHHRSVGSSTWESADITLSKCRFTAFLLANVGSPP